MELRDLVLRSFYTNLQVLQSALLPAVTDKYLRRTLQDGIRAWVFAKNAGVHTWFTGMTYLRRGYLSYIFIRP